MVDIRAYRHNWWIGMVGIGNCEGACRFGTISAERLICSFRSNKPENSVNCLWTQDNRDLVKNCDVVVLSVRPYDWCAIDVEAAGKLVVSVMAGVTVEQIRQSTGSTRVGRALPNAAAEIGYSYTPFFVELSEPSDGDIIERLFRSCGTVDAVNREEHIDYFTAMSGSGRCVPGTFGRSDDE